MNCPANNCDEAPLPVNMSPEGFCERHYVETHKGVLSSLLARIAELKGEQPAWRAQPPTFDEVMERQFWWNSGGPDGTPHVLALDINGDGTIWWAGEGCTADDWPGEWAPCNPPLARAKQQAPGQYVPRDFRAGVDAAIEVVRTAQCGDLVNGQRDVLIRAIEALK